jgi:signal transduction histidine kinase
LRRIDESWLWFLLRVNLNYDEAGSLLKITGVASDITEIRMNQMLLTERTEQLEVLFDMSPDAFMIFDHSESVKFVNPTFEILFKTKAAQIFGYAKLDFLNFTRKYFVNDGGWSAFEKVLLDGGSAVGNRIIIRTHDANNKALLVNIKGFDSSSISAIVYFRDITHESIVEEMKSNFLATAAHELRTPMTSIMGFSELLNSGRVLSEVQRTDMLDSILQQSIRMASILNELLDLARIEARGVLDFDLKVVDIAKVVQTVINDFSTPEGRTAPVLEIYHANCFIDYAKAIQALGNILSNAYKYSLSGPVQVVMRTSEKSHGFIMVDVVDCGIGIEEKDQSRLFERFFRADASCSIPGTGLGLSIVREIMVNMGGDIYFDSAVNQGSTFTLAFPLSSPEDDAQRPFVDAEYIHLNQIG